jgi:hypothetical protein
MRFCLSVQTRQIAIATTPFARELGVSTARPESERREIAACKEKAAAVAAAFSNRSQFDLK